MATATRRFRAFKRWIKQQGIEYSDALELKLNEEQCSLWVKALCELREGDVVAEIPKRSCLTIKNSAACSLIQEEAQLGGYLGLAAALMYEKSIGIKSQWFQYLEMMPQSEPIPLLWSVEEIDSLLSGTELHKTVKEDKALVYQDWKECIQPLLLSSSVDLDPEFFTIEEYFAAKSLIASRAFEIDEYHGFGMVPLADLFNHKTAAEDVHFTTVSPHSESDEDAGADEIVASDENHGDDEQIAHQSHSFENEKKDLSGSDLEPSLSPDDNPLVLEMIMVKDVQAGAEVFNTYGYLGNAALLHRYGFAEMDNPFDIVNIDLDLVLQWSSSSSSCRHSRRRLSLWRKLGYSGCISQSSEYFEISLEGEPQIELLVLLYIILLPDKSYQELDLTSSDFSNSPSPDLSTKWDKGLKLSESLLLTRGVCEALLSLADARESLYGLSSLEDDVRLLSGCNRGKDRKLYHSLVLRISERKIIQKLRCYANDGAGKLNTKRGHSTRKKVKRM